MLLYGMPGYICNEFSEKTDFRRVVAWDLFKGLAKSVLKDEVQLFVPEFRLVSYDPSSGEKGCVTYRFSEEGADHVWMGGIHWLVYYFDEGKLKKVPEVDIYRSFIRAM
jgi:hypothetical protein